MEECRRRLERPVLLFGGILILPRIGQIIWIAVFMAIYIRVTLVIARREELLEELHPTRETNERSACTTHASGASLFRIRTERGLWAWIRIATATGPRLVLGRARGRNRHRQSGGHCVLPNPLTATLPLQKWPVSGDAQDPRRAQLLEGPSSNGSMSCRCLLIKFVTSQ